jgi:two-component system heavy metal sensor histidine kinase CusS
MSSNDVRPRERSAASVPAWSIATRLTLWYAASAFLLVAFTTGFLYWVLVRNVDREDDQFLVDTVQILRRLIAERPADQAALREEVEWEGAARHYARVYVRIFDEHGRIIMETPNASRLLAGRHPTPAGFDAEPGPGIEVSSTNGTPFRTLAARARFGTGDRDARIIQVALDRTAEKQLLRDYRLRLWGVLGVALLAAAAVGHAIARRGVRPIESITETARGIRSSTLADRMPSIGLPAELSSLADTFNQMLGRLEDAFSRLSSLSADLAHELRTPLNNLRGEIEVALGKPRNADEYREVLESVLEECARLFDMIDGLMFLARAENPATEIVRAPIDVSRELQTVCELYELPAAERGVRISREVQSGVLAAMLDRTLFQRALSNLISNALTHTPAGGCVRLSAARSDHALQLDIADTGSGIPAEYLGRVSDRFYRVDPSRSSLSGGLGLGLAIVGSIVKVHGGTMGIVSEVGQGTRVMLVFPGAIIDANERQGIDTATTISQTAGV